MDFYTTHYVHVHKYIDFKLKNINLHRYTVTLEAPIISLLNETFIKLNQMASLGI